MQDLATTLNFSSLEANMFAVNCWIAHNGYQSTLMKNTVKFVQVHGSGRAMPIRQHEFGFCLFTGVIGSSEVPYL